MGELLCHSVLGFLSYTKPIPARSSHRPRVQAALGSRQFPLLRGPAVWMTEHAVTVLADSQRLFIFGCVNNNGGFVPLP